MNIVNLLADTGTKAPLAGNAATSPEPGAQFASILESATNVHGTPKGLTPLAAASAPRATATKKDAAGQALHAKFDTADLLASKDAKAEAGEAPKANPNDARKSGNKDAPKAGKKANGDDKGKHARNADAAVPNTPIAAAIHSVLAAIADQPGQNVAAHGAKGAASTQKAVTSTTGKLTDADGRAGSRHQLQQWQQTSQAVTSSATSSHAGSDTGASKGGQDFASQLLSLADASTNAAASTHVDNDTASTAFSGVFGTSPLPQAILHPNAPAMASTASLQAPVGSVPWSNELSQQLIRFSQRGDHQIELHLHPTELGPLQISLHVNDHIAQAHFFAAHAQVRDAVQQAIPQLREALAGQGIALGEAMVGHQQQQRQDPDGFAGSSSSPLGGADTEIAGLPASRPVASVLPRVGGGGVDLYA